MTDRITTTDAALTSLLAEMQEATAAYVKHSLQGAPTKTRENVVADICLAKLAVLDLVRGLRERAETAERERDGMARMLEAITPVEQAAQGATHHEVAGLWAELGIAPLPKISSVLTTALRERDEALRLLRVAMHGARCQKIGCHALATTTWRALIAPHCPEHSDSDDESLSQAADVRRIAELTA